jgi:hypothetical protein
VNDEFETLWKEVDVASGWGHTSAQNAFVVTHFVVSVVEIEKNQ